MEPYRIQSIQKYHQILKIPKAKHPLLSVINLEEVSSYSENGNVNVIFDFFIISIKKLMSGQVQYRYGQQHYDFDDGILFFIAPNQVFSFQAEEDIISTGKMLLVHPDFLWKTSLMKKIKQYEFFNYAVNEALFLSEEEESVLFQIMGNIEKEYNQRIDAFSEGIIVSQLELLLNYSERFYQRQFLTRKKSNHLLLSKLEEFLDRYFDSKEIIQNGYPTVEFISRNLNISPNYLSGVLKTLTGKSAQQHIQDKIIEKAKEKLSVSNLTINEIAFDLGFDYPQSFSKLFKRKTNLTPREFRKYFN